MALPGPSSVRLNQHAWALWPITNPEYLGFPPLPRAPPVRTRPWYSRAIIENGEMIRGPRLVDNEEIPFRYLEDAPEDPNRHYSEVEANVLTSLRLDVWENSGAVMADAEDLPEYEYSYSPPAYSS